MDDGAHISLRECTRAHLNPGYEESMHEDDVVESNTNLFLRRIILKFLERASPQEERMVLDKS